MVRAIKGAWKMRLAQWGTVLYFKIKFSSSSAQLENGTRFLFMLHHENVHYLFLLLNKSQEHKLNMPGRPPCISNLIKLLESNSCSIVPNLILF